MSRHEVNRAMQMQYVPISHSERPRPAQPVQPWPPEGRNGVHGHWAEDEGQVEEGQVQQEAVERELDDVTVSWKEGKVFSGTGYQTDLLA